MNRLPVALLLLFLAACGTPPQQGPLPRGFSQPGSPFPYHRTGW